MTMRRLSFIRILTNIPPSTGIVKVGIKRSTGAH
jgi:hypothetical protein